MATMFRAVVMLVVLVGLPAVWVYFGPLPPAALGVIERTVGAAKQSFGWERLPTAAAWTVETHKRTPLPKALRTQPTHALQQQTATIPVGRPLPQVTRDTQFSLASATLPVTGPTQERAAPIPASGDLARKLKPHLSLLRSLGAAEYTLENWGGSGQLYRFRCSITLGESDDHTRQFEAIDADPLHAVHQVVGEVTSWQNARHSRSGRSIH